MRPNFLWGLFPLISRHEFVPIGPVLVSARESAAGFQIVARLGRFWQHYRRGLLGSDPFSASLSALVWSGDLPEDFGGICPADIHQLFYERRGHDSHPELGGWIELNYKATIHRPISATGNPPLPPSPGTGSVAERVQCTGAVFSEACFQDQRQQR